MRVSIITVAYNAASTIADTLRSVAAQVYPDIEHIIVDGNSCDSTLAVIAQYHHQRLTVNSEPDKGLYDAMNKGVAMASGGLLGFLNADDYFTSSTAVSRLVGGLGDADAVCGNAVLVDPSDTSCVTRFYDASGYRPWMLRFGHMPPHPAFYTRRAAFDQIGGFDTDYRIGADLEWMIRFFHVGKMRCRFLGSTISAVREGGLSNRGLSSRVLINQEALASCRRWGISTSTPLLWSRYLAKSSQYLKRPTDYPARKSVRIDPIC
jgi:glycosyltransferase involved in cell wall biosynthesis